MWGSGNTSTLIAKNDDVAAFWSNSLQINVVENDIYEGTVEVVLANQPTYGTVSVVNNFVSYTPYEEQELQGEFSYYLKQGDYKSEVTIVTLTPIPTVSP